MEASIFYGFVLAILIGFAIKYKWPVREIPKDLKLLLSKAGRRLIVNERHDKHVIYTAIIVTLTVVGLLVVGLWFDTQVATMPASALIFLCGLEAFIVNIVREGYLQKRGGKYTDGTNKVPFSWRDIRFGTYSGLLTGAILAGLIKIFI